MAILHSMASSLDKAGEVGSLGLMYMIQTLINKPLIKIIMRMIDLNKVLRIALVILFLALSTLPAY